MNVSTDFEEFFALLNAHSVRYMVVDGYAFAVHAYPRSTDDVDLFIERSRTNAQSILRALEAFGFPTNQLDEATLCAEDKVIQMGLPPFRIDLLTSADGITFSEAWKNKVEGVYGEQTVFFIGKGDLIKNKRASGRKKDLDDLAHLTA